jgi:hypothetical protein
MDCLISIVITAPKVLAIQIFYPPNPSEGMRHRTIILYPLLTMPFGGVNFDGLSFEEIIPFNREKYAAQKS